MEVEEGENGGKGSQGYLKDSTGIIATATTERRHVLALKL